MTVSRVQVPSSVVGSITINRLCRELGHTEQDARLLAGEVGR